MACRSDTAAITGLISVLFSGRERSSDRSVKVPRNHNSRREHSSFCLLPHLELVRGSHTIISKILKAALAEVDLDLSDPKISVVSDCAKSFP